MISIKGKVTWVDIFRPTEKDITWIKETFHPHHLILEELRVPSAREKVEVHPNYLYLIFHFPVYDSGERVSRRAEIDFLITKKEVVTVRYEQADIIDELKKSLSSKSRVLLDTLQLTHKILESLLAFEQRQLSHIREKIDAISVELFRDRERDRERGLIERISYLKRDISQYRIIVRPQKYALDSLLRNGVRLWGEETRVYIHDVIGEHLKITDLLEDYHEAAHDFEGTNNQLIDLKHAEVTKTFTVLAFLTFPMMLFAALFSMRTRDTPFIELPYAFWIIFGIMAAAMTFMYAYFKRKDWL